jgi:hypothetical protein
MVVIFRSDEPLALAGEALIGDVDGATGTGAVGGAAVTIFAGGVMGTVTFGWRVGDGGAAVDPVLLGSRDGAAARVP